MFKPYEDMKLEEKHRVQGGEGNPSFRHLFSPEELGGRAQLMAMVTLQPGESVGTHAHETNGEVYLLLEGCATVTEDGVRRTLVVGDAEFCADGHTHSIVNETNEPARFLALILPNRA